LNRSLLLLLTAIVFVIGIVLSVYFNSLFIFIFIPLGLGWTFSKKSESKSESEETAPREGSES
jgi:hypothetical protein